MKNILILFKLSFVFSKKYILQYIKNLILPIIVAILGIILLFTITIDTKFVFLSILSIPCFCFSFWKGYKITYELIPCAHNFIQNETRPLNCYSLNKKQEKELMKYVCFIAIISILLYIPSVFYLINVFNFTNDIAYNSEQIINNAKLTDNVFLINTLILAPFLNYSLCAFYYKNDNENYFKLIFNCFKKLDIPGFLIAFLITLFSYKLLNIYILTALFINPFIYSINTFWYLSRLKK